MPEPFVPDNLAPGSPVSLYGIAPAYDPVARTGWRTVVPSLDNRVERRRTLQFDLVGRSTTGPLDHTLLVGFERNLESTSTRGHTWFKLDAAGVIRGLGSFTYAPVRPRFRRRERSFVRAQSTAIGSPAHREFGPKLFK